MGHARTLRAAAGGSEASLSYTVRPCHNGSQVEHLPSFLFCKLVGLRLRENGKKRKREKSLEKGISFIIVLWKKAILIGPL